MGETTLSLTPKLRPCIVYKETGEQLEALFHTWEQSYHVVAPSVLIGGHAGGQLGGMLGLCELRDGKMIRVSPEKILFLDSPHKNYDFTHAEEESEW